MKRLAVWISLLSLSASYHSVSADTPFVDNVPLEVVRQLVGNPYQMQGILYSDLFAAFPPFSMPANVDVQASLDQGSTQRVILISTLDEAAARTAFSAAFVAEGWREVPLNSMAVQQTGFVSAEQPAAPPMQLCHDAYGFVTIVISGGTDRLYITLNRSVGSPGAQRPGCNETIAMMTGNSSVMGAGASLLASYAPKLVMPQSSNIPVRSTSFVRSAGGGTSNEWETPSILEIDWSIDAIYAHFAGQVAEQGWTADAETAGTMAASGTWTKHIDTMDLLGSLTILKLADNTWDLRFRVVKQGVARSAVVSPATIPSIGISGSRATSDTDR